MKGATTTPWSPPLMMRHRSDLPPVAPQPWSVLIPAIPADSFYARLAQMRDVLVDDETYAVLYKDSIRTRRAGAPASRPRWSS